MTNAELAAEICACVISPTGDYQFHQTLTSAINAIAGRTVAERTMNWYDGRKIACFEIVG